jgi:uncharacterized protein YukE
MNDISVNPSDLLATAKVARDVSGQLPGTLTATTSAFQSAAVANMGGMMGPAIVALGGQLTEAVGKLQKAIADHGDQLTKSAGTFADADQQMVQAQQPMVNAIADPAASLQGRQL